MDRTTTIINVAGAALPRIALFCWQELLLLMTGVDYQQRSLHRVRYSLSISSLVFLLKFFVAFVSEAICMHEFINRLY